jgi:predicted  nucleic acid-binding Zn-ribbon protein
MQADAKTEEDNETLKVTQLMQTSQTKMLAAQQKMQTNMTTITAKDQNLNQKLNRLNNELTTLGPEPTKSRSADYSVSDASSDISGAVNDSLDVLGSDICTDKSKKCNCGNSNQEMFKTYQNNSKENSGVR